MSIERETDISSKDAVQNCDFVVGKKNVYLLDDVEVFAQHLNRPSPQLLDGEDFAIFPTVKIKINERISGRIPDCTPLRDI